MVRARTIGMPEEESVESWTVNSVTAWAETRRPLGRADGAAPPASGASAGPFLTTLRWSFLAMEVRGA
jgi:hypothetical protein